MFSFFTALQAYNTYVLSALREKNFFCRHPGGQVLLLTLTGERLIETFNSFEVDYGQEYQVEKTSHWRREYYNLITTKWQSEKLKGRTGCSLSGLWFDYSMLLNGGNVTSGP